MQFTHRNAALRAAAIAGLFVICGTPGRAQAPVTITVDAGKSGPRIDPMFYGLMTEEINFSYDGGLYAELIRNRTFRDDPKEPVHWSVVKDGGAEGTITLGDSAARRRCSSANGPRTLRQAGHARATRR